MEQYKITSIGSKLTTGYHVINGEWYRIDQVTTEQGISYYTNGIKEDAKVRDGKIISTGNRDN